MASDTLTEMESAASSMLKGPSSFSETWYRASAKHKDRDRRVIKFALTLVPTLRSYIEKKLCRWPAEEPDKCQDNGSLCLESSPLWPAS